MLVNSEEHRKVFPEPPLIVFRRCKNIKDILVRARLSNEGNGGTDKKRCSRCGKSRCQVCNLLSNGEHFHSNIDSREYRINYSFNCDWSNVVYLLESTVCGVQYVGSTCTPFRLRFNNYKACSRKFNSGASVPQAEFFRHFTEEGNQGFLKDISVKIIDRLTGGNRMQESLWQYRLDCFTPKGLSTRQVDTYCRFHFCDIFGCCVVLVLALSFSLGTHTVFLGFSVLPIHSQIFLLFVLL